MLAAVHTRQWRNRLDVLLAILDPGGRFVVEDHTFRECDSLFDLMAFIKKGSVFCNGWANGVPLFHAVAARTYSSGKRACC